MVLFPLFEPRVNVFIPFGVAAMAVGLHTWSPPRDPPPRDDEPAPVPVASTMLSPSGGSPSEMQ